MCPEGEEHALVRKGREIREDEVTFRRQETLKAGGRASSLGGLRAGVQQTQSDKNHKGGQSALQLRCNLYNRIQLYQSKQCKELSGI